MKRALTRGYASLDDPHFPTVLEAERDMQQLAFILDVFACHRDDPEFRRLVRHAICDSVLPQHNRKESPGRDAQCHLIVAAYCQNAGLTPVNFEEPDITCVVQSTKCTGESEV